MQGPGFEPGNPLRDKLLKLAPLTTWLPLHEYMQTMFTITKKTFIKVFSVQKNIYFFG